MLKKEIGIGAGIGLIVTILVGLGIWLGMSDKPKQSVSQASSQAGTFKAGDSKSSLNVKAGTGEAANLGQLNTSAQNQSDSGGGSPLDPTTFKQYEKYKDSQTAMFIDLNKGTGAELTAGKKAAVYYRGWLTDGALFDQSRTGSDGKLEPFVFQLGGGQVIPGWEQGTAGMKMGGVRLVIVPPAVGYGAQGQNGIPPNSVLVFQVQLVAVE